MLEAVDCKVPGTYLVRDERQRIPMGKTAADVSVIVHRYTFGYVCTVDGAPEWGRAEGTCDHIRNVISKYG